MGLSGQVPNRVDAATKAALLALLDQALEADWTLRDACRGLGLPERRANRWLRRREAGRLADAKPGGGPLHGLLAGEVEAILAVFEQWAEVDRSHRKLAHRGSYLGRFWCSPSTVRRVLLLGDKHFRPRPRPGASSKSPFPGWAELVPNSIWIYDSTHFTACGMTVLIIEDLISRKWLTHLVSVEETHTQVENAFTAALQAEGLLEAAMERAGTGMVDPGDPDALNPILLAVSDNGSQMISKDTRTFMTLLAIAQHFGRPSTPTDQAWIESLNGTIKIEWPHLLEITDPAMLRAELDTIQLEYNSVRLHQGIGYVTPNDEHEGRGEEIRQARRDGMAQARLNRLASHRAERENQPTPGPHDVG
ncbi:MAG: integrase core domain-containing protein [Pseudonocardia sp.]|nr:integrase core domain-containing protein [Pseudonocardia sp.]